MDIRDLVEPSERHEDLRREMDSLKFCREVYVNYTNGTIKANEHMDAKKAADQLGTAVDRVLLTWFRG